MTAPVHTHGRGGLGGAADGRGGGGPLRGLARNLPALIGGFLLLAGLFLLLAGLFLLPDLYHQNGSDIMRIQLPNSQAGFNVIDATYTNSQAGGWGTAVVGFAVRTSRGRTQTVSTGTITDQFRCWWSNTANPDVWVCGADSTLPSDVGDSGSPIYYPWQEPGGPPYFAAVGTLSNMSGNLAKIEEAYVPLNFAIYTPCGDGGC